LPGSISDVDNAFNIGLPILESKEAPDQIEEGDVLAVNFSTGEMVNENNRKRFQARPVPAFMRSIIDAGGLVEHVRKMA